MSLPSFDEPTAARTLWRVAEPVHAAVYFAPEVAEAVAETGVVGWWAGYVAGRSAPLGEVPAPVVQALFHGFAPGRVSKAVPAVWQVVRPAHLIEIRLRAVTTALCRLAPRPAADELRTGRAVELLRTALDGADVAGRALFAAHLDVPWPTEAVAQLWHACTLLREHRGDGHVAALTAAGVDGLSANLLAVAAGVVPDGEAQRLNRGWTIEQWQDRTEALVGDGLIGDDGALTPAGAELRREVERATDVAASGPSAVLGPDGLDELVGLLDPWVDAIVGSGTLAFPNPIGLTRR